MFEQHHFGLATRPFQLTPDPDFWFESATHRKAMAYLGYGLALGEGFIVITGEIGAGKTTLLGHLLATLDRSRVEAVQVPASVLSGNAPVEALSQVLGVGQAASLAERQAALEAYIAQVGRMGKRLLIAIDEAQSLSASVLEQLRLVSNIHLGHKPVVQFLLLGQPEFRKTLDQQSLEQLAQRVIASHHLTGLQPEEIQDYLEHRLRRAGWQGQPKLAPSLAANLAARSNGVPRLINQLMARAIMMAALDGLDEIDAAIIERVAVELQAEAIAPALQGAPACSVQSPPTPVVLAEELVNQLRAETAELSTRVAAQEAALKRILGVMLTWVDSPDEDVFSRGSGHKDARP